MFTEIVKWAYALGPVGGKMAQDKPIGWEVTYK